MFKKTLRNFYIRKKFPHAQIAGSARVSLNSTLGKDTRILADCKIGSCNISRYTYVGAGSELTRVDVGPFTSIGSEVICGLGTHPVDFVSTYPGFYSKKASGSTWFGTTHDVVENQPVDIGADVWIGTRAIILGGIKIGHGAIIATGAVVTKDIPDYAIAGGVPAKIIRYRFDQNIIERLLASRWWEIEESSLREIAPYIKEPEMFLQNLDKIRNVK